MDSLRYENKKKIYSCRTLYIYADDTSWGGKTLTLKDMDIKCEVSEQGKKIHVKIPLEDFVK